MRQGPRRIPGDFTPTRDKTSNVFDSPPRRGAIPRSRLGRSIGCSAVSGRQSRPNMIPSRKCRCSCTSRSSERGSASSASKPRVYPDLDRIVEISDSWRTNSTAAAKALRPPPVCHVHAAVAQARQAPLSRCGLRRQRVGARRCPLVGWRHDRDIGAHAALPRGRTLTRSVDLGRAPAGTPLQTPEEPVLAFGNDPGRT